MTREEFLAKQQQKKAAQQQQPVAGPAASSYGMVGLAQQPQQQQPPAPLMAPNGFNQPGMKTNNVGGNDTKVTSPAPADKTDVKQKQQKMEEISAAKNTKEDRSKDNGGAVNQTELTATNTPRNADTSDLDNWTMTTNKKVGDAQAEKNLLEAAQGQHLTNTVNAPIGMEIPDYISKLSLPSPQVKGRWNWNLQHSYMRPGSAWSQHVMEGAKAENGQQSQLMNYDIGRNNRMLPSADSANDIAMQRQRRGDEAQWKYFLDMVKNGAFSNELGEADWNKIYSKADILRRAYMAHGGNPDNLAPLQENLQGYKLDKQTKDALSNGQLAATDFNDLIHDLTTLDSEGVPLYYGRNRQVWDKRSENMAKLLGHSNTAIADAEKVRIQYLYQPEKAQQEFRDAYNAMQSTMGKLEKAGSYAKNKQDFAEKWKQIEDGLSMAFNTASSGNWARGLAGIIYILRSSMDGLWTSLGDVGSAEKQKWDEYKEMMIREANVDPDVMFSMIRSVYNEQMNDYNRRTTRLGGKKVNFNAMPEDIKKVTVNKDKYLNGNFNYASYGPSIEKVDDYLNDLNRKYGHGELGTEDR